MRETYDVIVVGGGIMGCSVAWQLERKQKRVLVIERRDVASGAVGARAARLLHGSHEGDDIALSPITGKLIAEWIVDGKPSYDLSDFDPNRFLKA